jgi:hypothetical protein
VPVKPLTDNAKKSKAKFDVMLWQWPKLYDAFVELARRHRIRLSGYLKAGLWLDPDDPPFINARTVWAEVRENLGIVDSARDPQILAGITKQGASNEFPVLFVYMIEDDPLNQTEFSGWFDKRDSGYEYTPVNPAKPGGKSDG